MAMTSGGLPKGWYADADEPGLSRYWDGTRWSGVRRNMHPTSAPASPATVSSSRASLATVSSSRWQRLWYGHVVRVPGVLTLLTWSNRSVPGLRGRLERALRPPQLRAP
jgi:hypothetical protein